MALKYDLGLLKTEPQPGQFLKIGSDGKLVGVTIHAHTSSTAALGSDVTMTTAGTYYDGPSLALTAGTWLILGQVTLQTTSTAAAVQFVGKLWDGTTVAASGEDVVGATASAAVKNALISLSKVVTLAGSATWKIRCTSNTASQLIKAATPQYGSGNNASVLSAVKIA